MVAAASADRRGSLNRGNIATSDGWFTGGQMVTAVVVFVRANIVLAVLLTSAVYRIRGLSPGASPASEQEVGRADCSRRSAGSPRPGCLSTIETDDEWLRVIQQGVSSFSCIVLTSEYMAACRERRRPVS